MFTTLKVIALVKLKMLFLCLCIDQFYFPKPNTSSRLLHTILQPQTMPVAPYQHSHSSENICISEVHCTWFSPLLSSVRREENGSMSERSAWSSLTSASGLNWKIRG